VAGESFPEENCTAVMLDGIATNRRASLISSRSGRFGGHGPDSQETRYGPRCPEPGSQLFSRPLALGPGGRFCESEPVRLVSKRWRDHLVFSRLGCRRNCDGACNIAVDGSLTLGRYTDTKPAVAVVLNPKQQTTGDIFNSYFVGTTMAVA
jgi:hypothetical protein